MQFAIKTTQQVTMGVPWQAFIMSLF